MAMPAWAWLGIAIGSEVVATSSLKASNGFTRPLPSAIVAFGYCAALYCLSIALWSIPMGVAYAVWSVIGIVLVAAIGWLFYGQRIDAQGLLAMSLIIGGAIMPNLRN